MKNIKLDVICPVYWINECFRKNVESWYRELPINRLLLGMNKPKWDQEFCDSLIQKYQTFPDDLEIIEQRNFKTLGACLVDLMNRVETEWFAYLHSDVFITPHAFESMKPYMITTTGIIESERFHWDGSTSRVYTKYFIPNYTFDNYYNIDRAFSGFQIFQKKTIQSAIDKIEDDYLYRNEDLIFQYECIMNGYDYIKTLAMHIHQTFNQQWTFERNEAQLMQIKGLIKYTEPLPRITKEVCLNALSDLKSKGLITIYKIINFCEKYKKKYWKRLLLKKWDEL